MVCQPLGLSVGYTNIKPEVFIFVQFLSPALCDSHEGLMLYYISFSWMWGAKIPENRGIYLESDRDRVGK